MSDAPAAAVGASGHDGQLQPQLQSQPAPTPSTEGGVAGHGDDAYKELPDLLPGGFHPFQPVSDADEGPNVESNRRRPPTDAVLTVRVIKSFEYRAMKALVLPHVDLTSTTVEQLKEQCRREVRRSPAFKAFRNWIDNLDTIKIYTHAHGNKTMNLIINLDKPQWILDDTGSKTLAELGLENEAELSFFHRPDYEAFVQNPQTKW